MGRPSVFNDLCGTGRKPVQAERGWNRRSGKIRTVCVTRRPRNSDRQLLAIRQPHTFRHGIRPSKVREPHGQRHANRTRTPGDVIERVEKAILESRHYRRSRMVEIAGVRRRHRQHPTDAVHSHKPRTGFFKILSLLYDEPERIRPAGSNPACRQRAIAPEAGGLSTRAKHSPDQALGTPLPGARPHRLGSRLTGYLTGKNCQSNGRSRSAIPSNSLLLVVPSSFNSVYFKPRSATGR